MENKMLLFQVNISPDYDKITVSLPILENKVQSVEMNYAHPIRVEVQAIELSKYVLEMDSLKKAINYDFYVTEYEQFGPCLFFVAAIRRGH